MRPGDEKRPSEIDQAIQQLARALAKSEQRHERTARRQRWFFLLATTTLLAVFSLGGQFGRTALAQTPPPLMPSAVEFSPQRAAADREALLSQMPDEARAELDAFEQRVERIGRYMQTWDERQAGAVVALMLQRIAGNMDAMPEIHKEMQTMNSFMQAMPVVAAEMQRMSAHLAVITANMGIMTRNMDSTMGRMGRMAPWP